MSLINLLVLIIPMLQTTCAIEVYPTVCCQTPVPQTEQTNSKIRTIRAMTMSRQKTAGVSQKRQYPTGVRGLINIPDWGDLLNTLTASAEDYQKNPLLGFPNPSDLYPCFPKQPLCCVGKIDVLGFVNGCTECMISFSLHLPDYYSQAHVLSLSAKMQTPILIKVWWMPSFLQMYKGHGLVLWWDWGESGLS